MAEWKEEVRDGNRHDGGSGQLGQQSGIRIPRSVCDMLGIGIGLVANMRVDQAKSEVVITFDKPERKYRRGRAVSLEEPCADWTGKKVGQEWDGPDVGAEVIE